MRISDWSSDVCSSDLALLRKSALFDGMDKKHPDLAAINRVGTRAICDHLAITRQSLHHWRKGGVPKQYRKSHIALGESLGHDMADLRIAISVEAEKVRGIPPRADAPVGNWSKIGRATRG